MINIKVLWFCNIPIFEGNLKGTGGWLYAMAKALLQNGNVELFIISSSQVNKIEHFNGPNVKQWLVPADKRSRNGLPKKKTIKKIQKIVSETSPDFIHVWGTENYWGLLFSRGYLEQPFLLDMQGVVASMIRVCYGGLSFSELIKCIWIKELIRPKSSLFWSKIALKKNALFEREIIAFARNISTQSEWVRAYVKSINPTCTIHKTGIILREGFYRAPSWSNNKKQNKRNPILFASSSAAFAFKGLHVLIRALYILKQDLANIQLQIGGAHLSKRVCSIGYIRWIQNEIIRLNLQSNVSWLGALDENSIIEHLQNTSVAIVPSYVESYSLALAESLILGVPTVVSYAGAMPEFAKNEESALFFPMGDHVMCAHQISRLLSNDALSEKISRNARINALKLNDPENLITNQLSIYNNVLCRIPNDNTEETALFEVKLQHE